MKLVMNAAPAQTTLPIPNPYQADFSNPYQADFSEQDPTAPRIPSRETLATWTYPSSAACQDQLSRVPRRTYWFCHGGPLPTCAFLECHWQPCGTCVRQPMWDCVSARLVRTRTRPRQSRMLVSCSWRYFLVRFLHLDMHINIEETIRVVLSESATSRITTWQGRNRSSSAGALILRV